MVYMKGMVQILMKWMKQISIPLQIHTENLLKQYTKSISYAYKTVCCRKDDEFAATVWTF